LIKDICKEIENSEILFFSKTGYQPDSREIFEYSSTGELFMIFDWYNLCKLLKLQEE
jgi:hypothetical protein